MRPGPVLATMLVLAACTHPDGGELSAPAPGLSPAQMSFLKFAAVTESAAPDLADLSGTIALDEQHTARLGAPVPGRVSGLLVQVGDRIAADQGLVVVDSPEVKAAQAEYVRADADRTMARKTAERATRLRLANAIAEKDFQQAQEDAVKADAELERARAQLTLLGVEPGGHDTRFVVRAPFAGTVVERPALVGMEAGPEAAAPLVVVSDLSEVRVTVHVPERQLPLLRVGQAVEVRVDAYPATFVGRVDGIGEMIDEDTRTVPVRCTLPNPEHRLKPAMFARVTVKPASDLRLLMVPEEAVLSDGRQFRVIVRRPDGQLEPRPVEVGAEADGRVQLVDGVHAGEEVVTAGTLFAAQALGS